MCLECGSPLELSPLPTASCAMELTDGKQMSDES